MLPGKLPGVAKQYASMVVGLIVSWNYGINALSIISDILASQGIVLIVPTQDFVGLVLTGVLVGRGGNLVNDLTSLLTGKINQVYAAANEHDEQAAAAARTSTGVMRVESAERGGIL